MASIERHDGRKANELRKVTIHPGFVRAADGSCLFEMGATRVICTASADEGVPRWRMGSGLGWLTAEYAMLPASTGRRRERKIDSRATEIRRLIGRVLRSAVRMEKLGDHTITLDCDVLEADGGTRTAAITGGYVALALCIRKLAAEQRLPETALTKPIAAVSVGIFEDHPVLDLDYHEDARAGVDMNVAMTAAGKFLEIQGSAEGVAFDAAQLEAMLSLARRGIRKLHGAQRDAIARAAP